MSTLSNGFIDLIYTKCVWSGHDLHEPVETWMDSEYNGLYELAGTYGGKSLYRQKQCIHGTENRTPKHAFYTVEDGVCLTDNIINDPLQCIEWKQPLQVFDNECPDLLTMHGLDAISIGGIGMNTTQIDGRYDVKLGTNMYRMSTSTNMYLFFDPYTFLWKFIIYDDGDDAFIGSYDSDQSCPVTVDANWRSATRSECAQCNNFIYLWEHEDRHPWHLFLFMYYPEPHEPFDDWLFGHIHAVLFKSRVLSQNTLSPTDFPTPPPIPCPSTQINLNNDEYNLIHSYPECFYGDEQHKFCNEMYSNPSNYDFEVHPNYEERVTAMFINMARLYPEQYRMNGKYGGFDKYWQTCGKAQNEPFFYNTKFNEAARFHNYDTKYCNSLANAHFTCEEPDRCQLFESWRSDEDSNCYAHLRWHGFIDMAPSDGIRTWSVAEGVCFRNACYQDGHCQAVYYSPNQFNTLGIGKWKGSNTFDVLYGYDSSLNKYPIPYGSHLDNRYYWNPTNTETNKMTFILEYYGVGIGNVAKTVYLLYNKNVYVMELIIGHIWSGFYEVAIDLTDDLNECEPYSFLVVTECDWIYRLPENKDYYFGTSLFYSYGENPPFECDENHYFNNNGIWMKNGGPLNKHSNENCIGCDKVQSLTYLEF